MKLYYSPKAAKALTEIYEFLCLKNERVAAIIHNDILDGIERLCIFPQMAPIEPLLAEEAEMFRSLVINRRYKAIYFIEGETITVVDIWDCRQNPETLKDRTTQQK